MRIGKIHIYIYISKKEADENGKDAKKSSCVSQKCVMTNAFKMYKIYTNKNFINIHTTFAPWKNAVLDQKEILFCIWFETIYWFSVWPRQKKIIKNKAKVCGACLVSHIHPLTLRLFTPYTCLHPFPSLWSSLITFLWWQKLIFKNNSRVKIHIMCASLVSRTYEKKKSEAERNMWDLYKRLLRTDAGVGKWSRLETDTRYFRRALIKQKSTRGLTHSHSMNIAWYNTFRFYVCQSVAFLLY